MAKYRIRWRSILRNFGLVVMLVRELAVSWKSVRRAAKAAALEDLKINDFISAGDALYRILVERRR